MTPSRSKIDELLTIAWNLGTLMLALVLLALSLAHLWQVISQTGPDLLAPNGMPVGADFLSLWSAAWLAATGNAAGSYDLATIFSVEQMVVPASQAITLWHYPPTFLVLLLPFGHLPYLPALVVFVTSTLLLYLALMLQLRPHWSTPLLVLAYPALWLNLLSGQNAFLSASLLTAALLALERSPARAGGWLGLLTYKPQLGVMIPIALLAQRRWTVIAGAAFSALLFALISLLAFGMDPWRAFLENAHNPFKLLENSSLSLPRMVSAFSMVRQAGWSAGAAYAAQFLLGGAGAICVLALWRSSQSTAAMRGASLALATLMGTPHVFHYDLAILAITLLLWLREAEHTGWLVGERPLLFLAWLGPIVLLPLSEEKNLALYPLLYIVMMLLMLRRTLRHPANALR